MAWTISDLDATVNRAITPTVADTIFKKILLIHLLNRQAKVDRRAKGPDGYVDFPIIVDKYEIRGHDNKMGRLVVPTKNILGTAKVRMATRVGSLPLTREERQIFDSPTKVADILTIRAQVMTTSLLEDIERRMFNQLPSNEGDEIDSLDKIVDDGTKYPIYAGVPRATNDGWKSYVKDMGGQPVTYEQLLLNRTKAKYGEEMPNLIFASEDQWAKLNRLIYDKQHYAVTRDDYLYGALQIENFKIGRAPCVETSYLPPGTILFLNLDYLYLNLLPGTKNGITYEGYQRLDLSTADVSHFFWDGQLFGYPRYHSKIINAG